MEKRLVHSPWLFFAITFCWSWSFWLLAIVFGQTMDSPLVKLLFSVGAIGPTMAILILMFWLWNATERREYWLRVFALKRVPGIWYAVIFLFTPLLTLVSVGISVLLGHPFQIDPSSEWLAGPVAVLFTAVFTFFFGPVPEELGWRGYALGQLQRQHSALLSSLILGGIWALWHIPLFFIPGSYQYQIGFGTLGFWDYVISIIPEALFITWVFNHTHQSTFAAILFHFMTNFNPVESIFVLGPLTQGIQLVIRLVLAVGIVFIWGPLTLAQDVKITTN